MAPTASAVWALLALLAVNVHARDRSTQQCTCSGLDYTNGGSYLIDGNSDNNFTFTSMFTGCLDSIITPILVSPNGDSYPCSTIESQPDDSEQPSQCSISYSQMTTGQWTIIIQAPDFDFTVQRQFNLTVGAANTVVVTVTPTVYIGWTSTPPAPTITNTVVETETAYAPPDIVTTDCDQGTDTIAEYIPGPTATIWSTISRWRTQGAVTDYYQTTILAYAYCHWPATWVRQGARRALARVADMTSTIAETTYTVTSTIMEVATPATTTEVDYYLTTSTYTPPAQTVCDAGETVTYYYQGPPQTDYEVQYVTYDTWVTVYIGQTQYSTATDYNAMTRCWQGGGWYGA
ncbi:hypothetical protein QBC46DRAFT_260976 [Diplogelasinospora grovesii]|uniref:Uncharacterized protein n=1 Tax=Diplogelasinospora grovesii TaxID=303347 RepID=A0AAN6N8A8_9PEZI|nr:hypothetical protein QBC46DRAFT_260976 [Diplogelasinospora grovesii]